MEDLHGHSPSLQAALQQVYFIYKPSRSNVVYKSVQNMPELERSTNMCNWYITIFIKVLYRILLKYLLISIAQKYFSSLLHLI